jgi:hypothetical protein
MLVSALICRRFQRWFDRVNLHRPAMIAAMSSSFAARSRASPTFT